MANQIKQFKLNCKLHSYQKGVVINLEVDDKNMPIDLYWKRRFIDAKDDNCIELVTKNSDTKEKKVESKQKVIKKKV
jgi:hypothetical protein